MEDLKQRIEKAYNVVEQKMKGLPGYKGYKEREVRREADKLLRLQVARGFEEQQRRLNRVQVQLVNTGRLGGLVLLDRAMMRLQLLVDRLKTASYGYAGLFSAIKVKEAELGALYEYDASLLGSVDKIKGLVDAIAAATTDADVSKAGNDLLLALDEANEVFSKRQDVLLKVPAAL